ncbi:MAG TPA: NADH-quinone oxidoreductase subunit L [Chitinophagales bacterium]|nr:NADH-quinone oxidoreductase subunit L [Chitinophagales bacterium]
MINLVWLVPLFPLIGFLINGLLRDKLPKTMAGVIGSGVVFGSFLVTCGIFFEHLSTPANSVVVPLFDWITAGNFSAQFSFQVDSLSLLMMLIVTGVGFLIHVYSMGYMHDDEGHNKFFSYLNLFIFFMLLLVMGSNYLLLFVGWEGVGLCSYLLIGFWFKNNDYNNAAKKAFIVNRIGDLGFLIGMLLIFVTFGTLNYHEVFEQAVAKFQSGEWGINSTVMVAITLLLFVGAVGKSAQIPLYTWLPDAMAGPTPVSALIHAATMVTAGVYMVVRSNVLYTLAPVSLQVVLVIGIATALFAATIGLFQNDIKKVLAYSTVSQLGYMFAACGVGAFTSGMFHLTTHAFFKALLFLGSGSVIHALGGEQDLRNMGGLKRWMPATFITFLIGTLAISGIPPLSGFFSKDEILANAFAHDRVAWALLLAGSLLTAFYMFRLFFLTFTGSFRGTKEQEHHLHESPALITVPLMALAILSAVGGVLGLPGLLHAPHALNNFLNPIYEGREAVLASIGYEHHHLAHQTEWMLIGITVAAVVAVIFAANRIFAGYRKEGEPTTFLKKLIYNKYYVDELYDAIIVKPTMAVSEFFFSVLESVIIDGFSVVTGKLAIASGRTLRHIQTGNTGTYLFIMVVGVIVMVVASYFI